jgi:ATP:corrinoid adenosyltransferase
LVKYSTEPTAARKEPMTKVTEMTLVKHHFKAGVKAQPGIEF